jgi:hypothetical protein
MTGNAREECAPEALIFALVPSGQMRPDPIQYHAPHDTGSHGNATAHRCNLQLESFQRAQPLFDLVDLLVANSFSMPQFRQVIHQWAHRLAHLGAQDLDQRIQQ